MEHEDLHETQPRNGVPFGLPEDAPSVGKGHSNARLGLTITLYVVVIGAMLYYLVLRLRRLAQGGMGPDEEKS